MTTGKGYDPAKAAEQIAAFMPHFIMYSNGAARRAKKALQRLFPDATFHFGGEEVDATMEKDGTTYPVFINVYPYLEPRQLVEELADNRRAAGKQRPLIFYITPAAEADKLAAKLRDDYPGLNAAVYIWPLDLDETEEGWNWTRGEILPLRGL